MKFLSCPFCKSQATSNLWKILYLSVYFFWIRPNGYLKCENCHIKLSINFKYIYEFFLYYFLLAIPYSIINYYINIDYGIISGLIGLIISYLIMCKLDRKFFFIVNNSCHK
jgi:hypothetical protein